MRTEFFIAKKILKNSRDKKKLSKPVIFISTLSIVLGVAIMIVTVSIVKGFQGAIREKVVGFDAHIQIAEIGTNSSMESTPMSIHQDFIAEIKSIPEIKNIQPYAYKPGVLQSSQDSLKFSLDAKDTLTSSNDISGVLFKGVNNSYDWGFIKENLLEGRIPAYDSLENQIVLSSSICDKMGYSINQEIDAFFIIGNNPKKRKFKIAAIYNTGLQEFDKRLIFCDLETIQELNNWGIQSFIVLEDTCSNGNYVLRSRLKGGNKNYKYNWGRGFNNRDFFLIDGKRSAHIKLVAGDYKNEIYGQSTIPNFTPDSAFVNVKTDSICPCSAESLAMISWDKISNTYTTPFGSVAIKNGKGTRKNYAGGLEITLNDHNMIDPVNNTIIDIVSYDNPYTTTTIYQRHQDIFNWLKFLDLNINIVIILILVVSLINMITSLLVLILEKTNMIGVLKAVGATNKNIRIIFIYHSFYLLGKGLLWGNILGIGLILLQYFTGFLTLNPDVYFLSQVPVSINLIHIFLINLLTILICRIVLTLPSLLISRIQPIKAIKFD